MKPTFASFSHRSAVVASAFGIACALALGGPVVAQGEQPDSDPGNVVLMHIDEFTETTGTIAKKMDRIVWAKCLAAEVRKVEPSYVETRYEFEILEVVKGSFPNGRRPGARFVLAHMGGKVGNWSTETRPPYPRLAPGDEVVLLADGEGDENAIISPTQSIYRVHTDAQGRKTVSPRPTGMSFYRASNGQAYERMPSLVTVEDFLLSLEIHVLGQ